MPQLEEIKKAGLEMPAANQMELHPFCLQKEAVAKFDQSFRIAMSEREVST